MNWRWWLITAVSQSTLFVRARSTCIWGNKHYLHGSVRLSPDWKIWDCLRKSVLPNYVQQWLERTLLHCCQSFWLTTYLEGKRQKGQMYKNNKKTHTHTKTNIVWEGTCHFVKKTSARQCTTTQPEPLSKFTNFTANVHFRLTCSCSDPTHVDRTDILHRFAISLFHFNTPKTLNLTNK